MNRKIIYIITVLGLILGFTSVSMAIHSNTTENSVNNSSNSYNGTIYVSITGNDSNDGFTPETSKKSIKKAVDIAPVNATILVAPGTYIEDTINIYKDINIIGTNPEETILESEKDIIKIKECNVLIQGFLITPKESIFKFGKYQCHGVYNQGNLILNNVVIKGFKAKSGAAISSYSNLKLDNCVTMDNLAMGGQGGGIYGKYGNVVLINSIVKNNIAISENGLGGGISLIGSDLHAENSIIENNHALYGGGIWCNKKIYLETCIIRQNTALFAGGGIYYLSNEILAVKNTLFERNEPNNINPPFKVN